jgi:YjbE family integral membrane protein
MEPGSADFWIALLKIIWVNILLSGDNAVVIALAARALPHRQQRQAVVIGSAAAIAMRIVLTLVAAELLLMPWLKTLGALLLVYIGVSLLQPEENAGHKTRQHKSMMAAIRTIMLADLVMSLDNVVAVAAASGGNVVLLVAGLAISIPLVIFGSTLLLQVVERFSFIVWLGAAMLGFIAGELVMGDPALQDLVDQTGAVLGVDRHALGTAAGIVGAAIVLGAGKLILGRHHARVIHE